MIFVIQDQGNGHVKIGFSADPLGRPAELQTGNSSELSLLFMLPGDRSKEAKLLERFAGCRVVGGGKEWFRPVGPMLRFIQKHLPENPIPRKPSGLEGRFEVLAAMAPGLKILLDEAKGYAKQAEGDPRFCANAAWYGYAGFPGIKSRVCQLVGWECLSQHKELRTTMAYDVAYEVLYEALPDCGSECACGETWKFLIGPEAARRLMGG